ncbi:MAG: histidine phosphatase family protein [Dehalococcoidia bacterium]|nr:MAG: histidine phosphatase family protein [Dehalococcoidia bacterium]
MTEIILARHGETEWNVGEIYRGRVDINLDEVGLKQAESLGKYLTDLKLDAVYSSPLRRALDTANIIARCQKVDVTVSNGLIDFDYGEWQGLPDEEVRKLYPALYDQWHTNPHLVKMPNGESLADVRERAVAAVNDVISKCKGSVVLVSHRVVNKVLICYLLGLDNSHFWNIKQDVCGITVFSYANGRFVLTRHNDTSYLRGLGKYVLGDF